VGSREVVDLVMRRTMREADANVTAVDAYTDCECVDLCQKEEKGTCSSFSKVMIA